MILSVKEGQYFRTFSSLVNFVQLCAAGLGCDSYLKDGFTDLDQLLMVVCQSAQYLSIFVILNLYFPEIPPMTQKSSYCAIGGILPPCVKTTRSISGCLGLEFIMSSLASSMASSRPPFFRS